MPLWGPDFTCNQAGMVSIVDFARAAGVSHQVVSKTLNGGGSNSAASAATVTRIRDLALSMGYRRSGAGRAMRQT